jgi:hypothetical protein
VTLTLEVGVLLLHMTHRLIKINICAKLFEIPFINDKVMDRTRKCDGLTDGQTDRRSLFLYPPFFFEKAGNKKGYNSVKMLDKVTSSRLQVRVMKVNKCAKFQKLEHKWLHRC